MRVFLPCSILKLVVRIDEAASRPGAPREIRGAQNWAKGAVTSSKGALSAQPALVDGELGLVAAPGGRLFRVLRLTFKGDKISQIEVVGDPARLEEFELAVFKA